MTKVKIFCPSKSAMQSGKKNAKKWLVKPVEETNPRSINSIMGWVSVDNTLSQFNFEFSSQEDAVEFAKSRNFEFEIEQAKTSSIKPKSYSANFTN